ncbi:MAG: DsrE family protein, partial [Gammaproteobacteria bacterium]
RSIDADISVLLCGNAVNYILKEQIPPMLEFGNWKQTQPTDIPGDIEKLLAKGVDVYVIREDLKRRGLGDVEHIEGVTFISRKQLPALFETYDQVWGW